jgi:hypothetical protein
VHVSSYLLPCLFDVVFCLSFCASSAQCCALCSEAAVALRRSCASSPAPMLLSRLSLLSRTMIRPVATSCALLRPAAAARALPRSSGAGGARLPAWLLPPAAARLPAAQAWVQGPAGRACGWRFYAVSQVEVAPAAAAAVSTAAPIQGGWVEGALSWTTCGVSLVRACVPIWQQQAPQPRLQP